MSGLRSLPIEKIVSRGSLEGGDIRALRRIFYEDGIVKADEAEILFQLNAACRLKPADWSDFFIEAITDYLVFQERPQGYLTAANARWLIDHISDDDLVGSKTELELLVNVLAKARWAPVSLAKFALGQVKAAVVTGDGPLRVGKAKMAGEITETEVELIRRILYAFGGDGHVAITCDEADILFDIDEAVASGTPNPAWTDLFVKAIANVVMAASGYAVPSREEALRQDTSPIGTDAQGSVLNTLLSMVQSNLASIQEAYHDQTAEERALARLEHQRIEIITNEQITAPEASWLVSRLGREGRLSASETALVSYLGHESPKIHPVLTQAVAKFAPAA
ncbi:hypothetical protein [Hyphomicrobium sp.]|jgi:hypothetical protein|uniref:hypothetical protein n=1 Tax=Hyphomicrobium sp. TaxID=82 RepID=UPI002C1E5311|nr:hypothetical protein [Hyphomicrobium sp.]HVZ04517.1 hypothetical protein [Hyphomicrobium sp.]